MKGDAIDSWENIPEHSESVWKAERQATLMIAQIRHEKHGLTEQLPGGDIDDSEQLFKDENGGFTRLDRIFAGELQQVLDTSNESIWQTVA